MKRKSDGTIDRRTTDGRASILAQRGFVPERLDPDARAISVAAKLPPALVEALDRARGDLGRSAYIRRLIERDTTDA